MRAGIFPTFFLSGFECSTFVWKDQGRRDLAAETGHYDHAHGDYALLASLGIGVAREGVPWPLIDKGGECDFTMMKPLIAALRRSRVVPIWDLCHYGYPDDVDPFAPDFATRFADYARKAAVHLAGQTPGPSFFTPINEISFFADMGGNWGWVAPHLKGPENRAALLRALCTADLAAAKAIREAVPDARLVHIDPLVHIVAPRDRPDLEEAARAESRDLMFAAWDMIAGRSAPELGGSPDLLDIVGVNCYSFGQTEFREGGPHEALPPGDDRIRPLCDMIIDVWERYRRPMIIGETSGLGVGRDEWLDDVMHESLAAVARGVDLQGICLFPAVDMPNWHDGKWLHNGLCDLVEQDGDLRRVPVEAYCRTLRSWQHRLSRTTALDRNPLSDPVDLADIEAAAKRMTAEPDSNWH
jgi:beta-glucosidase/6-phospho-beta-glucosidase/beta-galactosidase